MRKRYGLPFKGYMSSLPRHMVPDDYLAEGYNFDYAAKDGSFSVRYGSRMLTSAMLEQAGATIRPRRVVPFTSTSPTDGEETFGVLYGGSFGCFAVRSTGTAQNATPDDFVVGYEFGSGGCYPSQANMIPLLANGAYTRLRTAAERALLAEGSANCVEVGDWLYFPSYDAIPHRWNKKFVGAQSLGAGDFCKILPAGNVPPLSPPKIDSGTSWSTGDGPWEGGKYFYVSAVYEFEDGTYSQPFIPRPVTSDLSSGLGLVAIPGAAGTTHKSVSMTLYPTSNLVRKIHVLATPIADTPDELKILDLQVWFTVDHNLSVYSLSSPSGVTVTAYDFNLLPDPRIVRFDRTWMPPCKFMWTGDQRTWAGYNNGYRGGILISTEFGSTDDYASAGGVFEIGLSGTTVTLYGDPALGGTNDTISLTGLTMQQLCDKINSNTAGTTPDYRWTAQLVPGTDPNMSAEALLDNAGDNTSDSAAGKMRAFGNAFPAVLWLNDTVTGAAPINKRRVFYTEGGPGLGGMSGASWIAGNYRDVADQHGDFVAGGSTPNGQVCAYSRGIAVLRNTRDNRTGLDQDYYFTMINERRGCISADSFVQGDGWVGYLTEDGFVCCDGEREVIISGAVYNPATKVGDWATEIDNCKNAARAGTNNAMFRAMVSEGKLRVSFRGGSVADRVMVYDFSGSSAGTGLAEVLRPDGTPWGWSTPHRYEYDTTGVGIGPMAAVHRSDGTHIYAASDTTTTNGRVERIESASEGAVDWNATHNISCTTNTNPGTDTILSTAGTFLYVPQTAGISGTGTAVGAEVASVDSISELAMSAAATSAGTNTITFTGKRVVAKGYSKMETLDLSAKASVESATAIFLRGSPVGYASGLRMSVSRDSMRSTERYFSLADSETGLTGFSRKTFDLPLAIRSPAKYHEFGFDFDGHDEDLFPSFWGVEAEYEVLDSNR